MERPLVVFDVETTGVDIAKDRIITLAAVWRKGDEVLTREFKVNPGVPIPAEATAVHGISDDDVKDWPSFKEVAAEVLEIFKDADIAGFNSNKFDVPILAEELERAGLSLYDPNRKFIDAFVIFRKKHPRDLAAAYLTYCGRVLENAHDAMADTEATFEILEAQMAAYADEFPDRKSLHDYCEFGNRADFTGHLVWGDDGRLMFNFGKWAGKAVTHDHETIGYAEWMLSKDFSNTTKAILRDCLAKRSE